MIKLGISKQPHKVRRVARLHVVPLQVERDVAEGDRVAVDVEGANGRVRVLAALFCLSELALEVLGEVGGCCGRALVRSLGRMWEREHAPSDEMDAPESLNSSEPIWTGNTRSCGRMLGMWLAANFLGSGSKNSSSATMVDDRLSCALPGLAMVQDSGIKRQSILTSSSLSNVGCVFQRKEWG